MLRSAWEKDCSVTSVQSELDKNGYDVKLLPASLDSIIAARDIDDDLSKLSSAESMEELKACKQAGLSKVSLCHIKIHALP